MSKATIPQEAGKLIPFSSIDAPLDINSRQEYREVEELAASIKEHGLLTPLTVRRNGTGSTYILVSGFRRFKAMKALHFKAHEIPVVVRDFETDAELHEVNLVENVSREDLHPADLAESLWKLVTGNYPCVLHPSADPQNDKMEPVDEKKLSNSLGLSVTHINNLVRTHEKLDPGLKKLWRRHDIPLTVIFRWTSMTPEEQLQAYEAWHAEQEEKSQKPKRGKKNGREERESADDEETEQAVSRKEIRLKLENLIDRQEKGDSDLLSGKIQGLKWVLGQIQKL